MCTVVICSTAVMYSGAVICPTTVIFSAAVIYISPVMVMLQSDVAVADMCCCSCGGLLLCDMLQYPALLSIMDKCAVAAMV